MRLTKIALLASIACAIAVPAAAADLSRAPITKAPIAAPVIAYNWSGFYIGGHVGGTWGDKDWTDVTFPAAPLSLGSQDISGILAGGQVGINWQVGNIVFGIEGQASWTNADGDHTCVIGQLRCGTEANWLGTVAGRIGYAFDRTMIYAKGGAAFINEDFFVNATPGGALLASFADETRWGWMVGGGIEWGITENWSAKIEYNFMDFREDTFRFRTPAGAFFADARIDQQMHVVKAGINYRFNWGGAGPIAARY
jgi:outer membrane immunogenic protein